MMPFVIVALVLALAVIGVLLATGPGTQATAVDAGVVAQRADARAAIDASIVVPPTPDAAPAPADAAELVAPPDARAHTTHADAAIRPPPVMDAAVVHAKPDAAETPTLAGAGTLKLLSRPEQYANVSIDGALAIPTPQFHLAVPAGKHTIQFQDPKTGTVIYTTTVVVADKQAVTVQPPAK
jgi:hypothetical protein